MDFRIDTGWRNHPKRIKLRRRLGADGVLAIEDLWAFCAESRPSGDLSGMDKEDIAIAAKWDDTPDTLVSALVELRLLDVSDGAYRVHDFEASQPYVTTSNSRKINAQKAIHERWARAGKCKGGTQWCDERCPKSEIDEECRENTDRITTDTTGNTPTILPTNLPTIRSGAELSAAPPHPPTVADEVGHTASVSPAASEDTSPEVLRIPLLAGEEFVVTETLVAEWGRAYPAVAIEQELRALREWALSNPAKRKKNGRAFCTRNLARKQEEGGTRRNSNSNNNIRRHDPTRDENGEPIPPYLLPIKFDADGNPYRVDLAVQR